MKRILFILYPFLILIVTGCPQKNMYPYICINNSDYDIVFYVLFGGEHIYPDTSFIFKPTGIIKAHSKQTIHMSRRLENIIQETHKDTLSFFYFHSDTLNKYPLEVLQRDYKILQRYDLSSEDIRTLYGGKRGTYPEIPYPPDERMQDMKMYPPYGSE